MPAPVRWTYLALGAWLLAAAARNVAFPGRDLGPVFDRYVHDAVLLAAGGLCLLAARRRSEERRAWALIGAGILAWALGESYFTTVLWTVESVPVPSPADAGYLLMPPLVSAGLVLLLRARAGGVPPTLLVDGVTAGLAVAAGSAAIAFDATLGAATGDPLGVAITVAYPAFDLVFLGFVVGALAATGWRLDRTWALLGAGVVLFWVGDSFYLVQIATDTYESDAWFDAGWWIGLFLISLAAWQPAAPEGDREGIRMIVLPLCFATIGLGLLIYGCFAALNPVTIALAALALVAVMARLILTFRDNTRMLHTSRGEALTDPLTGLANRRALARRLERSIPTASDAEPVVLALFDLDGFKLYNDTFGHPAGDALLIRLGDRLQAYLSGRGEAFRMGGDEFCALIEPGEETIAALVDGAGRALSEQGEGFSIGCSYGSILLPREAQDASEALRIADQRMYAQKHAGRSSASRQSRDVLLRALAERNPALSSHSDDVANLSEAVAVRLGLSVDDVQHVRHAAELHDVGKVAIPDDILSRPGPLDDHEWVFMRSHTVIGERIIAAAPALTAVASLVRSSHERWDGAGYPDELTGAAIPLGSRIVAVADAFDAMTTDRPYSREQEPAVALEELRRCSGHQFDPAVVEAFCAEWAARTARATVVARG